MANDIEVIFSGQEAIDVTVDLSTISGSLRIFNSDESFDQTITEDTELSDIIVGDSLTSPSNVNVGVDDWDKMVSVAGGIGYNYPLFSGQEQIYRTWDDKYVEDNVFTAAVRLANGLKPRNWLAAGSFDTLINNNAFGNTLRFTDSVGAQNADGTGGSIVDYAIDHLTGLGYYLVFTGNGNDWNARIDGGPLLSVGGFSDFFLPSMPILESINQMNSTLNSSLGYWPFTKNGNPAVTFWVSSTTVRNNSANQISLGNSSGVFSSVTKSGTVAFNFYCRKHY
jgi:hypothetical protein